MLGRLLWKSTPKRGPSHESTLAEASGEGESGKQGDEGLGEMKGECGNLHGASYKRHRRQHDMAAACEGRSWWASEATLD